MTGTQSQIHFTLDGQPRTTIDDDQEAAALLRSVGRDPSQFDLTRIDDDGDETFFGDTDMVRVKQGDRFRARPYLRFTIDGEEFVTHDDDQTVEDLLRRSNRDPERYDLARVGEAQPLRRDELVVIRQNDRFVTARRSNPVA